MANWDDPTAQWDSGHWDSPSVSNPTPKKKKTMKRQDYVPVRIGDTIVWLRNIKTTLPGHATTLGLDPAVVTARLLDVDNAIYGLEAYRGAIAAFNEAGYQRIEDALYNAAVGGNIVWLDFTLPGGQPVAVAYGCMKRLFDFIADDIKTSPTYDITIGLSLRVEGSIKPAPDAGTTVPEFDLRGTSGGKLEIVWTKGEFDGVKVQIDLGTAGIQNEIDLRPNFTLNWLPPAGTAVTIKVRLRYIYRGEDFGNWSDWQTWTLAGV